MSFFGRLFEKKGNPVAPILYFDTTPKKNNWKKEMFYKDGYYKNPIFAKCVNKIVDAASDIPVALFNVDSEGEKVEVTNQPDLEKLLRQPNVTANGKKLLKQIFTDYWVTGDILVAADAFESKPTEIWRLNPANLEIKYNNEGVPEAYIYKAKGGGKKEFPIDINGLSEAWHYTYVPTDDNGFGSPPAKAAATWIDLYNLGGEWNASLLDNGGRPSGALVAKASNLSDEQVARLKADMKENIEGAKNAGKTALLEGDWDWMEFAITPKDMDYSTSLTTAARNIADVFGVPFPLISPDAATFNNMENAVEQFYEDVVIPFVNDFWQAYGNWLLGLFKLDPEQYEICPDIHNIPALEFKNERKAERMKGMVEAGVVTINEARAELGIEMIENDLADEIYISANRKPISFSNFDAEPQTDILLEEGKACLHELEQKAELPPENIPPIRAQEAAAEGLAMYEQFGKGGTSVTVERARAIASGVTLSRESIELLAAYRDRMKEFRPSAREADGSPMESTIAILLRGGLIGISWAAQRLEQMESE